MNEFGCLVCEFESTQIDGGSATPHSDSSNPTMVLSIVESQSNSTRELGETSVNTAGMIEEPRPITVNYVYQAELFGSTFLVEEDAEGFLIHHIEHALSGEGATFRDAIEDLLVTARELKAYFAAEGISTLSESAILFRRFLLDELNV